METSNEWCPSRVSTRPILFNVLVNDIDSGTKFTLSTCVDDTKLSGVADSLEGRNGIHRYFYELEE